MSLPYNNSGAGPNFSMCRCHGLSGLPTSKFCPDCGQRRAGFSSLSDQLSSSLSELSLITPVGDVDDISYAQPPVVIAAGNWSLNSDPPTLDNSASGQAAAWRSSQPFNMRTVMLSATMVFSAFTVLFFVTARGVVGAGNTSVTPGKIQTTPDADDSQAVLMQPMASQNIITQTKASSGVSTSNTAATNRNGAVITNEPTRSNRANMAGRSTPVPRMPSVTREAQQVAPASVAALPRVESRVAVAPAPVAVNDSRNPVRTETLAASSAGGPMRVVGARPVYVRVSPNDGAPDDLNEHGDDDAAGRRYSGTNGYIIVNGRVAMDGTAPVLTVSSPNANGNYVGYFPALQGAANSPAGVETVELETEKVQSAGMKAAYWNGEDWMSSATRLTADMSNGIWRYSGALPDADKLVAGYYRVKVYAQGFRGPERKTAPVAIRKIRVFPKGPAE